MLSWLALLPTLAPLPQDTETVWYDWVDADGRLAGGVTALPLAAGGLPQPLDHEPEVTTLFLGSGLNTANRVDMVFVGDGYLASELASFDNHVDIQVAAFFAKEPFTTYSSYFNVHRVDVVSNESGVDNDPVQGILRDTALDMAFWCSGIERLLCVNVGAANSYAAQAPDRDYVIAVANSTKYGGAGYSSSDLATVSGGNSSASEVMIHEMGHALGNLADEYTYGGPTTWSGGEPGSRNLSTLTSAAMAAAGTKWAEWLGQSFPGFDGLHSTYEGGGYSSFGIYRPSNNSLMRSLGRPFNMVGVEAIILALYSDVDPIDDSSPTNTTYDGSETLFVTPLAPGGTPLSVQWSLDGTALTGATGLTLSLASLNLSQGLHTVSVTVVDDTAWVRDEAARAALMTDTRSFPVDVNQTSNYCLTAPNSAFSQGGTIDSSGGTSVSENNFRLLAYTCVPSQFGVFYYGTTAIQIPFGDGYRCVGGSTFRFPPQLVGGLGDTWLAPDLTNPPQPSGQVTVGSTWRYQFWYRDPNGASGFNLTDALAATFTP